MILKVTDTRRDKVYGSFVVEPQEGLPPAAQPVVTVRLPFVSGAADLVQSGL